MPEKQKLLGLLFLCLTLIMAGCSEKNGASLPLLKVEFTSNLDPVPVFSWKIEQDAGSQKFWQVEISETTGRKPDGKLWDSGKIPGENSLQFKYDGPGLKTGESYSARVRVWDQDGNESPWSKPLGFVIPLEYPKDWNAGWITYEYNSEAPLPVFRKSFILENTDEIESARFYISAPGFYEALLNGEKIGRNVLDPGQTNYEDYTYYSEYDISPDAFKEKNVLGILIGNGWYNQNVVWGPQMIYGQPVLICQLVINYTDGSKEVKGSGADWLWKPGPITWSNIYGGEHYDARLEADEWFVPEADETGWKASLPAEQHPTMLVEQFAEPIQVMEEIQPVKITEMGDRYIVDFGRNIAGWARLKISGETGQKISIRYSEEVDSQGEMDFRSTGVYATKLIQNTLYTCRGGGEELWEPRFTYFGFRYAEISGLNEAPEPGLLTAMVVRSSVAEAGNFQCSEKNINRLHELARWTIEGNIHSIPTDCPHREKCGWTGDAHAMIQPMIYNYDSRRFFNKYMFDMRSSGREEKTELYFGESFQDRSFVTKPAGIPTMIVPGKRTSGVASPDWGTALVQIPWYLYLYYGDRVLLEDFYPDMKTWVDYIHARSEDGIIPHGLGDWCPPGGVQNIDCPVPVSSSAFHILDVKIMKEVAAILGFEEDHEAYSNMHEKLVSDFNRHFFNPETSSYGSQTADAMALDIGMVPTGLKEEVAASIVKNIHEKYNGFINTGIFGIARLFDVLCENGQEEEAYRLLTKKGRLSFAFMWDHWDATTLWEVLPVSDHYEEGRLESRSHSHPMQAGYEAWFFSGIAGINPSPMDAGFRKIVFRPYMTRYIESASASYESGSGKIESSWESSAGAMDWKILIPWNSSGDVYVPAYGDAIRVNINGEVTTPEPTDEEFVFLGTYGPGEYNLKIEY